jgi:hypothetical protein
MATTLAPRILSKARVHEFDSGLSYLTDMSYPGNESIGKETRMPNGYANPSIVRRISIEQRIPLDQASELFQETLNFLDLCNDASEPLAPSRAIDAAWHTFILHTADYASYCQDRFGRFLHHVPTDEIMEDAYILARKHATQRFGALDPGVWPATSPVAERTLVAASDCTGPRSTAASDCTGP